jgi:hypothetical protein
LTAASSRARIEIKTFIGVSQPVPHAADIAPRLARHEFGRAPAETMGGFANPFQAATGGADPQGMKLHPLSLRVTHRPAADPPWMKPAARPAAAL